MAESEIKVRVSIFDAQKVDLERAFVGRRCTIFGA